MLCINFEKVTSINAVCDKSQRSKAIGSDWSQAAFIEVNVLKLMHIIQIFRNNFVSNHCHLCKISAQIIECKNLSLILISCNELCNTILSTVMLREMLLHSHRCTIVPTTVWC